MEGTEGLKKVPCPYVKKFTVHTSGYRTSQTGDRKKRRRGQGGTPKQISQLLGKDEKSFARRGDVARALRIEELA